jgi:hypothetical protein
MKALIWFVAIALTFAGCDKAVAPEGEQARSSDPSLSKDWQDVDWSGTNAIVTQVLIHRSDGGDDVVMNATVQLLVTNPGGNKGVVVSQFVVRSTLPQSGLYYDQYGVNGQLGYIVKCIPPPEYSDYVVFSCVAEHYGVDPIYSDEFVVKPEDFSISWEGLVWAYPRQFYLEPKEGTSKKGNWRDVEWTGDGVITTQVLLFSSNGTWLGCDQNATVQLLLSNPSGHDGIWVADVPTRVPPYIFPERYFDIWNVNTEAQFILRCIPSAEYADWTLLSCVAEQSWVDPIYSNQYVVKPEDFNRFWENTWQAYPRQFYLVAPAETN